MLNVNLSRPSILILGMLCIAIIPSSALASGYLAIPGSHFAAGGLQSNLVSFNFEIRTDANRSYACTAIGFETDSELEITSIDSVGTGGLARSCGNITPAIFVNSGSDSSGNNNRWCLLQRSTSNYMINVNSESGGGEPARVECVETTLYGGYNTNANPFNFLEVTNLTNAAITFQLFVVNDAGTFVIDGTPFVVDPNKRQDIDIHTPVGANKYGMLWIAHNGPYGALQATVSQYSAALEQRASISLRPRDQNL